LPSIVRERSKYEAVARTLLSRAAGDLNRDVQSGRTKAGAPLAEDAARAEGSLIEFVKLLWPEIEPARPLIDGWALRAIAEHLEAVTAGQIKNLLINVPPGCMKSLLCNVFWPAWEWGPKNRPSLRILSASYIEKLAIRDNMKMRHLIRSDRYRQLWGHRFALAADENSKTKFSNDRTGFKAAAHVGGATGERGDRTVLDDPHNVTEAESDAMRESARTWYSETWSSRVNDSTSATIVIMQRLHREDISGLILEKFPFFEHLCLPMRFEADMPKKTTVLGFTDPRTKEGELLWPERFSEDYLKNELEPRLSAIGGPYAIAGQFQQRPAPRGGGLFKEKDFQQIVGTVPDGAVRVRGWDLASSVTKWSAFTAGVKLAMTPDRKVYVEDVIRGQWTPHQVEEHLMECARGDGGATVQDLPQDPGQSGKYQVQALASMLTGYVCYFSPETGSKEDRANPFAAQAAAGNVFLVRGDWNRDFVKEACDFPNGHWKDQIDAASRAFAQLVQMMVAPAELAAPRIIR
jgi:predicted phage terminase large subunit-like protein